MKGRRTLIQGLESTPDIDEAEKAFVFGEKLTARPMERQTEGQPAPAPIEPTDSNQRGPVERSVLPQMAGRVPVTIRCRPEIASAIKRVSLQRQLDGVEPYFVQDIMEQALENWLQEKGYSN